MPMRTNQYLNKVLLDKSELFTKPLLPRGATRDQLEYLQRLCGKNSQQAMNIAMELVRDMEQGTYYPPINKGNLESAELVSLANRLIDTITIKKQEAAEANKK